ncbi:siroheme synthase CysG [Acidihalobacter prosperus]|uniref:Siroheme synthase n=1 Tax=Acidihalobacter prosperus TaxID=160660 RepID=A0A1A6C2U4_9GAMM|nr:siroheme synthase CysG [Acidihalobacter prosperus]OBS08878.1 Siroheme synthase [Acidihalobacter prosperus]
MRHLPIFMDVQGHDCLVVGGGPVAVRKAGLLLEAGAKVTVVAPEACPELAEQVSAGRVRWQAERFAARHLAGRMLVIAATDDAGVNRRVYAAARSRNLPVNVADQPALCSFILPAVIDRAPVTIAVSSGGNAPVLARHLKTRLETLVPHAWGRLAGLLGSWRGEVKRRLASPHARRRFWEDALEGRTAAHMLAGDEAAARASLADALAAAEQDAAGGPGGEVWLVGAGPGDPELLTLKALRLLQRADVIVYDRLVGPEILSLARREAERIFVGKRASDHALPQEAISDLLVRLAGEGKRVLRLKGGDPFIFGRGGEEIERLAAARIPFQVVPGVTAASGCAAYAGIPLTHRDCATSVRFVTGHTRDDRLDLDWAGLAAPRQTLVFYMGLANLPEICRRLMENGMAADTPAALVEQGTTPGQQVHAGDLTTLPELAAAAGSPSLVIVGEVVALRERLGWYEGTMPGQSIFDGPPCKTIDDLPRSEVA